MSVKSVAIIGAGAAGAVTAAALKAENHFERVRVFERRGTAGGTWIYDADPGPTHPIQPGKLPKDTDPPLDIPSSLPTTTLPNQRERWTITPVYNSLTTNVPEIAMSFSDSRFAYGPFVPHYVPRQYVESYFPTHGTDPWLVLNTTVEDVSRVPAGSSGSPDGWKLVLRKYDPARHVDVWWEEHFDAVVIANGHYSVPFVPQVPGLEEYIQKYPGRVIHSKFYRSPLLYQSKRVVVIGNSASGHDIAAELTSVVQGPVYVSRRSRSRWEGDEPPPGIEWKPVIEEFRPDGSIKFSDGTSLDNIDAVIYCTGYKVSFPFWNEAANKRPLWDYESNRLLGSYWHTFFHDFPTLGIVGIPRTLTFRSFEYQAIALARLWSNRNSVPLPPPEEQRKWEQDRAKRTEVEHKKFHDVPWDDGETAEYLDFLFKLAGLGTLKGEGRIPPILSKDLIWALEHVKKYPDHPKNEDNGSNDQDREHEDGWVVVDNKRKDLLAFL